MGRRERRRWRKSSDSTEHKVGKGSRSPGRLGCSFHPVGLDADQVGGPSLQLGHRKAELVKNGGESVWRDENGLNRSIHPQNKHLSIESRFPSILLHVPGG